MGRACECLVLYAAGAPSPHQGAQASVNKAHYVHSKHGWGVYVEEVCGPWL